jgi:tetratricopeptide (TPR) repeat protein
MQAQLELSDWDWNAAASDFRAIRVEYPNNVWILSTLRVFYQAMGFPNEAIDAERRAQALDPLSDHPKMLLLYSLIGGNRFPEAIAMARDIVTRHPDDAWRLEYLCDAYVRTAQIRAAREVSEHLRRLNSSDMVQDCDFEIDVAAGDDSEARTIMNNWIAEFPDKFPDAAQDASDIAKSYVALNNFDRATDWYERAYDRHEVDLFRYISEIDHAKYRQTAGYKALSQRPGFKAWQAEHDKIAAELSARGGAP